MKSALRIPILISLLLSALVARPPTGAQAEDAPPASPAAAQAVVDWARIELRGGGRRPSLALRPADGVPYLSFYESNLQRFFLGRYTGNGNHSCGGDPGWTCVSANNTPTAGDETRFSFDPNYPNWFGVAWSIPAQKSLYISSFDLELGWLYTTDTFAADPGDPNSYVRPTDLMYANGSPLPVIEKLVKLYDGDYLKDFIARRHGLNDPAPVERLMGSHSHGRYASLDLGAGDDGPLFANATERLAYRANTGWLRFAQAKYDGNGTGCQDEFGAGTVDWSCAWVDNGVSVIATDVLGPKCSGAGCAEVNRIFYVDATSGRLKLATRTGNAAHNCSGGVAGWSCGFIDSIAAGKSADGLRISMAATGQGPGEMKIAYTDKDDGPNSVLKLATYTGIAGDTCAAGGLTGWKCEVVDDGGSEGDNTGSEPSLGWNGDRLYIAYVNQTQNKLMVAFPRTNLSISYTKTYSPARIMRGGEYTITYTVLNLEDYAVTGLRIVDGLLPHGEKIQVLTNTCGGATTYTEGNLADLLSSEGGAVKANSACQLALKMKMGANAAAGAFIDNPSALESNEGYPITASGTSAYTVARAAFMPSVAR